MTLQNYQGSHLSRFPMSNRPLTSLFLCFCLVQLLLSGGRPHHDSTAPTSSPAVLHPHPRWGLVAFASAEQGPPTVSACARRTSHTTDFLSLNDPSANCSKKVTIPIELHDGYPMHEEAEFVFVAAKGPGDKFDYLYFKELTVRLTRRDVIVRHDVSYLQEVNSKPYETPVPDTNCNSEFNPNVATCGLATEPDGTFALFSQGFCCDCTTCYDGSCERTWRAKACSSKTTKVAACLRRSNLYYDGYSLESPPKLSYVIDVRIWGTLADYITTSVFTIRSMNTSVTISPDMLQVYNATDEVIVMFANRTVNQDLRSAHAANITGKVLFIPSRPKSNSIVTTGESEWMFLDPTSVTVDGSECDKVGTSYRAFAAQFNACNLDVGTCLEGQLGDLRKADMLAMSIGFPGMFMAPNYGDHFSAYALPGSTKANYIGYPTDVMPERATIDVVVNADRLISRLPSLTGKIWRVGIARLEDVHVPKPRPKKAAGRTASTGKDDNSVVHGGIFVEVSNSGINYVYYRVTLDGCSSNVNQEAIPALWGMARPYSRVIITPPVKSSNGAPINTFATCTVRLWDQSGRERDSRSVQWAITERGFQDSLLPNETTSTAAPGTGDNSCADSSYYNGTDACHCCDFFTIERNFQQECTVLIVGNVLALLLVIGAGCELIFLLVRWLYCPTSEEDRKAAEVKAMQRAQARAARANRASHDHATTAAAAPAAPPQQQQQYTYAATGHGLTPQLQDAMAARLAPPLSPEQLYLDPLALALQMQSAETEYYYYYYYESERPSHAGSATNHSPYGDLNSRLNNYVSHYATSAAAAAAHSIRPASIAAPPTTRAPSRRSPGTAVVEEVSDRNIPSHYAPSPAPTRVEDVTPLPRQPGTRPTRSTATVAPNRPRRTLNDIDGDSDVEGVCPLSRGTSRSREPFG